MEDRGEGRLEPSTSQKQIRSVVRFPVRGQDAWTVFVSASGLSVCLDTSRLRQASVARCQHSTVPVSRCPMLSTSCFRSSFRQVTFVDLFSVVKIYHSFRPIRCICIFSPCITSSFIPFSDLSL